MRWLILAAIVALSAGCPRSDGTAPPIPKAATLTVPDAVLGLFDAVGDAAPLTVAVRPDAWPALHASATALAEGLPPQIGDVLAQANTLDAAAALAAPLLATPLELGGLDRARPLVLGLFEPFADGAPGIVSTHPSLQAMGFPGFRHRAALPATDAAALSGALAASLAKIGAAEPALVAGHPGGHGWRLEDGWIALWPAGDHVRIEAVTHAMPREGVAALAPAPPSGPPARTPALLALAHGRAGALIRGWRLRGAGTAMGAYQGIHALASYGGANADELADAVGRLLLASEGWMNDAVADFDDHAAVLEPFEQGVRVRVVSSLARDGRVVMAAATQHAAGPFTVKNARARATLWSGLDLDALVRAARMPGAFARPGVDAATLAKPFQECGVACMLHGLLRQPFGLLAGAKAVAEGTGFTIGGLPRTVHVVMLGPTEMAGALDLPATFDVSPLRDAMKGAGPLAQLHVVARDTRQTILVGLGVDPRTVFDPNPSPATPGLLGQGRLDLASVALALRGAKGPIYAWLARLAPVDWTHQAEGHALIQTLVVRTRAGKAPAKAHLGLAEIDWPTPQAAAPQDAGNACLVRAIQGIAVGLDAVTYAAPEQRGLLRARILTDVEADLTCAVGPTEDAQRAAIVAGLRALVLLPAAEAQVADWDFAGAVTMFEAACKGGVTEACTRREAVKALPTPDLPVVETQCDRNGVPVIARLHLPVEGPLRLDDVPVSPGDLGAKLAAAAQARGGRPGEGRYGALALAMDAKADVNRLASVWAAADGAQLAAISAVTTSKRGVARIDMPLAAPASAPHVRLADVAAQDGAAVLHLEPGTPWGPVVSAISSGCGEPTVSFEAMPAPPAAAP